MFLLLVSLAVPLRAVAPDPVIWIGGQGTPAGNVTDAANWNGTLQMLGADDVLFNSTASSSTVYIPYLTPPDMIGLHDIKFDSTTLTFDFSGNGTTSYLVLDGSLTATNESTAVFNSSLAIQLTPGTHTADVGTDATITIDGNISDYAGASGIKKMGAGTLKLSGTNSFTGGVTLEAGSLLVGSDTALGQSTSTLILNGGTLAPIANVSLANNITLSSNTKLGDCDTSSSISFTGVITGSGAFDTHGYGDITFAGNNSNWSGGLSLYGANNVFVNHANGLGSGPVWFDSSSTSAVHFNESATISSLSGGDWHEVGESGFAGSAVILAAGKSLTIDQSTDTTYLGKIAGTGDAGFSKDGTGSLTLGGPVNISGPVTITKGTLAVQGDEDASFYSGAITVGANGTFALKGDPNIYSDVTVAGKLTGNGYVSNATIQAGGILSPGTVASPVGYIDFADLTLAAQSTIVIGVKSDGEGSLNNSEINVLNSETLTLSGIDATHKLTLKLISDGVLTSLVAGQSYQLRFLYFNNQAGGTLDASNVTIDATGLSFESTFSANDYSLQLYTSDGNYYFVNFTPVPEPSTYALMALGLAGTGLAAWRKRRRA